MSQLKVSQNGKKLMITEYDRGYNAAKQELTLGQDPNILMDQGRGDDGMFRAGWEKACVEAGAQED